MKSQDTVMSKTKIKQEEVVTEAMLSDDDQKVLKEDLQKWRKEDKVERGKLTLFSAPLKTLYLFVSEISLQAGKVVAHLARHPLVAFLLVASLVTLAFYYFVPGLHQQKLDSILHEATIALEWIVLGVLSSIGLGTGLHVRWNCIRNQFVRLFFCIWAHLLPRLRLQAQRFANDILLLTHY